MPSHTEQGGDLVVIGHNQAHIPLLDFPHRVEVVFRNKHEPPPCDPHHHHHHHDKLEWEVKKNQRGHHVHYTLIIDWQVHDIREIIWTVFY
jgi:hypothetical protein